MKTNLLKAGLETSFTRIFMKPKLEIIKMKYKTSIYLFCPS